MLWRIAVLILLISFFALGCIQQKEYANYTYPENQSNESINQQDIFYLDLESPRSFNSQKVILLVDSLTYSTLKSEIDRFADDIKKDMKTEVVILSDNYQTQYDVKNKLQNEKQNGQLNCQQCKPLQIRHLTHLSTFRARFPERKKTVASSNVSAAIAALTSTIFDPCEQYSIGFVGLVEEHRIPAFQIGVRLSRLVMVGTSQLFVVRRTVDP